MVQWKTMRADRVGQARWRMEDGRRPRHVFAGQRQELTLPLPLRRSNERSSGVLRHSLMWRRESFRLTCPIIRLIQDYVRAADDLEVDRSRLRQKASVTIILLDIPNCPPG